MPVCYIKKAKEGRKGEGRKGRSKREEGRRKREKKEVRKKWHCWSYLFVLGVATTSKIKQN